MKKILISFSVFVIAFILLITTAFFLLEALGNYICIKIINCYNEDVNIEVSFNHKEILNTDVNARSLSSKWAKIYGSGSYTLKVDGVENKGYIGYNYDMSGIAGCKFKIKTFYIIVTPDKKSTFTDFFHNANRK